MRSFSSSLLSLPPSSDGSLFLAAPPIQVLFYRCAEFGDSSPDCVLIAGVRAAPAKGKKKEMGTIPLGLK